MDEAEGMEPREEGVPRHDPALLAPLLGPRLKRMAAGLRAVHEDMPAAPRAALRFHARRARALAPRPAIPEGTAPEEAPRPGDLARFPSSQVDGERRALISRVLGVPLPAARIHHHHFARETVRRMGADALAVGRDILVESPRTLAGPRGLALLGHELTHAAQESLRPRSRAATAAEERVREITAVTHERILLGHGPGPHGGGPGPAGPAAVAAPARPAPRAATPIRAAAAGRDLGVPAPASAPSAGLDASQLRQIQDAVYRDLMLRVREEFERGS